MKKNSGRYANNIPALVATALPPLNLSKIEKVWPIIAINPNKSGVIPVMPKSVGNNVATAPLEMSIIMTILPAIGPKTR